MEWQSNMTRDEKEKYVLELYQQGRTVRYIAQVTHMSFREIGAITKPYKQKTEQVDDIKSKSKVTQAINLFSEGKDLVDVVIALDLQPDQVREIYRQFLKLKDMHELVEVYDGLQNYLPSLLELFRIVSRRLSRGLNVNDVIDIHRIINTGEFEYIQRRIKSRMDAESWLDNEIKKKEYHLRTLNNRIRELSYREWDIIPMTNTANELTSLS